MDKQRQDDQQESYIQQLSVDMCGSLEDLTEATDDRDKWQGKARNICAGGETWYDEVRTHYNFADQQVSHDATRILLPES